MKKFLLLTLILFGSVFANMKQNAFKEKMIQEAEKEMFCAEKDLNKSRIKRSLVATFGLLLMIASLDSHLKNHDNITGPVLMGLVGLGNSLFRFELEWFINKKSYSNANRALINVLRKVDEQK